MNSTETSTPRPDPARCPRCGGDFACGAPTGHCDCFELKLSAALREQLAARYADCLCMSCLRALQAQDAA